MRKRGFCRRFLPVPRRKKPVETFHAARCPTSYHQPGGPAMTRFLLVASILLAAGGVANAASPVPIEAPKLSGPHTVDNLTLFFIHGPDTLKGDYLTLQEAMRDKKVIVHETENVNELAVENVSDKAVYIQSGEIVKGGKQDRTLANDL